MDFDDKVLYNQFIIKILFTILGKSMPLFTFRVQKDTE